ncbi:hypothetical protein RJ639_007695 [Escallonia herrerae]|uniref:Thiaminase-2/PQQC domain-containing protein n=1 Tax=Escallonia herrerae TaxID=1293975 RepID=A0AA89AVF6_9ASTE|nr:hypothetical protein RJ639_007695 [Escallonia herrerae]
MSSSVSAAEEGNARRFWIKSRKESILALYTPFVVCLASGSLRLDAFQHYVAQDAYFLKAFAQAYELAEECADDDDAKVAIGDLRKSVLEELKMHNSFVQEWGSDLAEENALNSATVKYTDFLLATASGKVEGVKGPGKLATPFERTKIAAYTLGAMTPCMRLYAFIGKEIQALLDTNDSGHLYNKWIENYSSESFQASALQNEDLLDKLSVSLTGEELGIIEKLYHQAMRLEIEFFLAQPLTQQTVVPLLKEHNPEEHRLMIFSDFDLTCTVVDSSAILAEIAIVTAPKSEQNVLENQIARMPSADLRNSWAVLSRQYTEEYEQCIESILLTEKAESFYYDGLSKALEELSEFEKRANTRVIESEVLKGLNIEDIKRAGERLILQDGCTGFFQSIINNENLNANVHVLSYCWCGDLIRSALSSDLSTKAKVRPLGQGDSSLVILTHVAVRKELHTFYGKQAWKHESKTFPKDTSTKEKVRRNLAVFRGSKPGGLHALNVHANEFTYEGSLSTGEIIKKVESPIDKVRAFSELQQSSNDRKNMTIYIGDSVGDLLCLLKADVGIVVGSSSSLRRVGSHFGVSFVPLFPSLVQKQKECVDGSSSNWRGLSGILYTVSSWAEIHAFILGS